MTTLLVLVQLITSLGVFVAAVYAILNHNHIQKVKLEINGRMDQLMAAYGSVEKQKGIDQERRLHDKHI